VAPLVLAAAAALAASAVWAAPRSPGVASPCGLGLPPPEFGEPAFEVPDGGSVREERLEGGALECILRRADGTRFARAYRDTAGQVIEVAFYRESGQLREDEDAAMAAPSAGSATTRSAEVTCGSSHTASLGSKYWRKSFVWRIGHTVSGIAAGKAVNVVRYAEGEWLNNANWCGIKDEASISRPLRRPQLRRVPP
jgi:hypothetical protein